MSRNVTWRTARAVLPLLLFYLYVWLVIDPRLIYHSLGLLTDYSAFAFSDGWPFLQEHLARPGGLVEYLGALGSQLFCFGWAGALVVTAMAWSLCLFADLMTALGAGLRTPAALGAGLPTPPTSDRRSPAPLETFGRPGGAVGRPHHSATGPHHSATGPHHRAEAGGLPRTIVRYVPAAVLLVIYGRYYHPIDTIVSLLAGLSCFAVYLRAAPAGTKHRLLVLLLAVMAAYHVAGAGSLVFPILAATHELFVRRRTFVAVAALLCGLGVPWLVGTLRFGYSPGRAYGQFLLTDPGLARAEASYGLILLALFPLVLSLGVVWRVLVRGRPKTFARFWKSTRRTVGNALRGVPGTTTDAATPLPGTPRRAFPTEDPPGNTRGYLGGAVQTAIVLAGLGAAAWFSLDMPVRTVIEMDEYVRQEKWAQVLATAERMPRGQTSVRCSRNVLLALYHTGRLGDEMFRYPQIRGMSPLGDPEGDADFGALFQESRLCFYLGQINYAEKCAYDALGVAGDVPAVLEHLALVSVARGRIGAAHVLLNALGKNPFYRRRATEMIRRLEDDPRLEGDPRVRGISSIVPDSDSFTRKIDVEDVLLALLKKNPRNRMAFEFLMAHYLVNGRPEKVAQNVGRLKDLGYAEMPRHFQEALLISLGLEGAKFHAAPYDIQPGAVRDFESFLAIVRRESDGRAAARDARAAGLGDTYFYFLTFGTSGL